MPQTQGDGLSVWFQTSGSDFGGSMVRWIIIWRNFSATTVVSWCTKSASKFLMMNYILYASLLWKTCSMSSSSVHGFRKIERDFEWRSDNAALQRTSSFRRFYLKSTETPLQNVQLRTSRSFRLRKKQNEKPR